MHQENLHMQGNMGAKVGHLGHGYAITSHKIVSQNKVYVSMVWLAGCGINAGVMASNH